MTTEEATPITLPPDLRAMVEAILGLCRDLTVRETGDVHGGSVLATATSRLRVIYDTAQRLKVALEQRERVMGETAKALADLRDMGGALTERQAAQNEATYKRVDTALAKYEARHG